MFLNYLSLFILLAGLVLVFYVFVYIHDLPYSIAKKRNHPQVEAIHVACWLSLLTLHAIWPLVFIWAIAGGHPTQNSENDNRPLNLKDLHDRLKQLENRLALLEKPSTK